MGCDRGAAGAGGSRRALRICQAFHDGAGQVHELLLRRVLHRISCRNYERAAEGVLGTIGLLELVGVARGLPTGA